MLTKMSGSLQIVRMRKLPGKIILIKQSVLNKNDGLKKLVENGFLFNVVYVKKLKYSYTVAIKVSPEIRQYILNDCTSKLYVFSARCRVSDRCYFRQFYHCQEIGHISIDCPYKSNKPTCMYCAGDHHTAECKIEIKVDSSKHKCSNCRRAKEEEIVKQANSHHAGSHVCPLIEAEETFLNRNTETIPKNSQWKEILM